MGERAVRARTRHASRQRQGVQGAEHHGPLRPLPTTPQLPLRADHLLRGGLQHPPDAARRIRRRQRRQGHRARQAGAAPDGWHLLAACPVHLRRRAKGPQQDRGRRARPLQDGPQRGPRRRRAAGERQVPRAAQHRPATGHSLRRLVALRPLVAQGCGRRRWAPLRTHGRRRAHQHHHAVHPADQGPDACLPAQVLRRERGKGRPHVPRRGCVLRQRGRPQLQRRARALPQVRHHPPQQLPLRAVAEWGVRACERYLRHGSCGR